MSLWTRLGEFFYPCVCLSCERLVGHSFPLCAKCSSSLKPVARPYCSRCGLPLAGTAAREVLCGECLRHPPAFDRARAAFIYNQFDHTSALARAIARFKYTRKLALGSGLAELLRHGCPLDPFYYDWITPVPLTLERLRWRGFNQALALAHSLGDRKQVAANLLERTAGNTPQAGLGRRERLTNVRGAFRVRESCRAQVSGAKILLVDDVMTTGATVNECSVALKRGGAQTVDVLVLARVILS